MATQFIDARHRESLQPPGWLRQGPLIPLVLGTLPSGRQLVVGPLPYREAPPFLSPTPQTPITPVIGQATQLIVAPRTGDLPPPAVWTFGNRVASVNPALVPSSGNRMSVLPSLDVDEAGALTLPGIIDSRLPFATRLVVPPVEAIQAPGFLRNFSGTGIAPTATPPLGARAVVPPQDDKPVFSWLRGWNGAALPIPTRASAGAQLTVRPVPQVDAPPFTWNYNGSPVIPGVIAAGGLSAVVPPVDADTRLDALMSAGACRFFPAPPPIPGLIVPNVVGLYVYEAQLAILQAGFMINTPVEVDAPGTVLGIVLTQSIAAGSFFLLPQQITITVAAYLSALPPLIS